MIFDIKNFHINQTKNIKKHQTLNIELISNYEFFFCKSLFVNLCGIKERQEMFQNHKVFIELFCNFFQHDFAGSQNQQSIPEKRKKSALFQNFVSNSSEK